MLLSNKNTAVLHYFTNGKYSIKSAEVLDHGTQILPFKHAYKLTGVVTQRMMFTVCHFPLLL